MTELLDKNAEHVAQQEPSVSDQSAHESDRPPQSSDHASQSSRHTPETLPYLDTSLSIDERISDLLSRMTLAEKAGQMMQLDARGANLEDLIVNRHVGSILHTAPGDLLPASTIVAERTRLHIPLLIGDDCIHGYSFWPGATIFPIQLAMACSFNPELVEKAARATAREVSTTGVHWTFSPVLCIARDTRWGRVGETFGEDPYLIAQLASAMVRGYQAGAGVGQRLASDAILACAKHFAGYSETQGGRDASEADLSHRKLASWFLPPFERVAREGCATFMLGYESIDGIPVTYNDWLLTDVLRGQWGYKGALITDWDNVGRSVWEQHVKPDYVHASADAVLAGNDLVMTTPQFFDGIQEAVKSGLLPQSRLDEAVKRILALKFRLGLFEDPRLPDRERMTTVIGCDEHQEVNLELARQSVVLLRNVDHTLPLEVSGGALAEICATNAHAHSLSDGVALADSRVEDSCSDNDGCSDNDDCARDIHSIALVGPLIDAAQTQLGDWAGSSGQVTWMKDGHPREAITTIADGLRETLPSGVTLKTAQGANIVDLVPDPDGEFYPDGQPRPLIGVSAALDEELLQEAVSASEHSDVTIAVVGDVIELVGETCSTATLELQGGQVELLNRLREATAARGAKLIVVLMSSKPQVLPQSALQADALLWAPSPGMQGGAAVAQILLGAVNPSGRLPITFPRHVGQLPVYYNQIRGQHSNRYADLTQEPQFAFGEGESYSRFEYGQPVLDRADGVYGMDDVVTVKVAVRNMSTVDGTEVVQCYVSDIVTSYTWAERELKGVKRVFVKAGQSVDVTFDLPVSDMTIVDSNEQRIVEPGEFDVLVGHSSKLDDLNAVRLTVR